MSRDYRERVATEARERAIAARIRRDEQHANAVIRRRAIVFRRCKFINGCLARRGEGNFSTPRP